MRSLNRKKGFTIVELLFVIAIIGLLSSIVLNTVNEARASAKIAKARATLKQIRNAIHLLEDDTREWPKHKTIEEIESGGGNEIWDLNTNDSGLIATDGLFPNWNGPYITRVQLDPWGNSYFFDTDYDIDPSGGEKWVAVVGSFGPNGVGPNLYDSDDIFQTLARN